MPKQKSVRVKLSQNKALRRRALTWLRMFRYGANNFTRNAWLTTAATAVMTITLLIIFTTVVARNVLTATVAELRQKVDVSVYLRGSTTENQATLLTQILRDDENVTSVRYISSDQAREAYISTEIEGGDVEQLETLAELDPETFPAELRVTVEDPDNLSSLEQLVREDEDFQTYINPNLKPTFAGERRGVIQTISGWAGTAERVGIVMTVVFVAISMLIVFNTIRMAIFNRKEEIQMMKLIGADKGFIRGPFVVEAVMYGFIAAIVATALGIFGLLALEPKLAGYGIAIVQIKDDMIIYAPLVLMAMIFLGALIGIISSRLAVRRYLKV